MTRRTLTLLLPVLLTAPVMAAAVGGWASITVEDLPDHLVAGQPAELAFIVRQHGVSPLRGLKPTVTARSGRREVEAAAAEIGKPGRYTARITVPEPGEWTVTIQSGFGKSNTKLLPLRVVDRVTRVAALAPADRGKQLFVAKGCVTCHTHRSVESDWEGGVGPELSVRRLEPAYLAKFLADPSIQRTTTNGARMPDFELKEPEIMALVAFLNAERQAPK